MSFVKFAGGVLGQQGGGAAFNPETDMTGLHSLFWAEGTQFVARAYANTDPVGTWDNETGESDAVEATNQPTYVASGINGQPSVLFDGNDILQSAAFALNPSYTAGVTVIAIADRDPGLDGALFDDRSAEQRIFSASGTWRLRAGAAVDSAVAVDFVPHLFVATFDGSTGNETLTLDGTQIINANAGSNTLTGVTIGGRASGGQWVGSIAFVAVVVGNAAAMGWWADFEAWVTSHYGITIA